MICYTMRDSFTSEIEIPSEVGKPVFVRKIRYQRCCSTRGMPSSEWRGGAYSTHLSYCTHTSDSPRRPRSQNNMPFGHGRPYNRPHHSLLLSQIYQHSRAITINVQTFIITHAYYSPRINRSRYLLPVLRIPHIYPCSKYSETHTSFLNLLARLLDPRLVSKLHLSQHSFLFS